MLRHVEGFCQVGLPVFAKGSTPNIQAGKLIPDWVAKTLAERGMRALGGSGWVVRGGRRGRQPDRRATPKSE